jgi:hypothetical protein
MFNGDPQASDIALAAASFLANSKEHLSHGRRISIDQLRPLGIKVLDLRTAPPLREAVWSLYHAISWTFDRTAAFKIVENGHGDAFVRQVITQTIQIPFGATLPGFPATPALPPGQRKKRKRH